MYVSLLIWQVLTLATSKTDRSSPSITATVLWVLHWEPLMWSNSITQLCLVEKMSVFFMQLFLKQAHLQIFLVCPVLVFHNGAPRSLLSPHALFSLYIWAPKVDAVHAGAYPSIPTSFQFSSQVVVLSLQIPQLRMEIKCGNLSTSSWIHYLCESSRLPPQTRSPSRKKTLVSTRIWHVMHPRRCDVWAASRSCRPASVGGAAGTST